MRASIDICRALRLLPPPRYRRRSPPTPILEISSKIHPHPSNTSFKITTRHHSDALSTHPLLRLMHSTNTPNCHLEAILIPEPSPHLKLFVVSSTTILPYTPLRIRPPPEPPPTQQHPIPTTKGIRSESNNTSLITSYFKRDPVPNLFKFLVGGHPL